MNHAQLPTEEKNYIVSAGANTIVKQFVTSIKKQIKGARKIVHGVECETLKEFGAEILRFDNEQIGTATVYAGFRNDCIHEVMPMADIKRKIDAGETLTFIKIKYTLSPCNA